MLVHICPHIRRLNPDKCLFTDPWLRRAVAVALRSHLGHPELATVRVYLRLGDDRDRTFS